MAFFLGYFYLQTLPMQKNSVKMVPKQVFTGGALKAPPLPQLMSIPEAPTCRVNICKYGRRVPQVTFKPFKLQLVDSWKWSSLLFFGNFHFQILRKISSSALKVSVHHCTDNIYFYFFYIPSASNCSSSDLHNIHGV